jgi:light-regulated signal transduction histidine kinase (bacteriophytochrome)
MNASLHGARLEGRRFLAAEEELRSFSYIVSHDMAASLRHLTVFSRMLLDELGAGLTERERIHADRLYEAGTNCQAMLDQLLVYSHVQQKALEKVRQDSAPILHLTMLRLGERARAAGAEISLAPLGEVHADAEQLALAFAALLDNAIKFARPETPPRIAVTAAHDKAFWRMRISDNGLGVEPAYREASFQMFRRLHRQNAYPGVGAGLTICRRIARRHGGEAIFLDCAEGACVEFSLPHAPRSARAARHLRES